MPEEQKPNHTPVPWNMSQFPDMDGYKIYGGKLAFRNGPRLLAVVKNQDTATMDESEYNAHLFLAAPELLEACRYMHRLLVDMGHGGLAGAILGENAIRKAEGRNA